MKEVGKRWQSLKDKSYFENKALWDKGRYENELTEYQSDLKQKLQD